MATPDIFGLREYLEDKLDKAHALLADIREHGDYGSDWDEKITKLLVLD